LLKISLAYFIIFYIRHSKINTKELIDNDFEEASDVFKLYRNA
jgi:hypothetical protein